MAASPKKSVTKRKPPRKPGRPTKCTAELTETICVRLAGGESLRSICKDGDVPDKVTVLRWLFGEVNEGDPRAKFRAQYALAREIQAEMQAEEIVEIADDGTNDWMERKREDGSTETSLDHEHVQRSKLRVDARKWVAAKLLPKKYGDKTQLVGDGGGPVLFSHEEALEELAK